MFVEDQKQFVENCVAYISTRVTGGQKPINEILIEGETEDTYFLRFSMSKESVDIMHEVGNHMPKDHAYDSLYSEMARSFLMYGLYYITDPIKFKDRQYTDNGKRNF